MIETGFSPAVVATAGLIGTPLVACLWLTEHGHRPNLDCSASAPHVISGSLAARTLMSGDPTKRAP
jgi:hypothetical protein